MGSQDKHQNSPCFRLGAVPCNTKKFPQAAQEGGNLPIDEKGGFVHQNGTGTKDFHSPSYL